MRAHWLLSLAGLALALTAGCGGGTPAAGGGGGGAASGKKPKVAVVTNGVSDFWVIADKGSKDAGKEFNADVVFQMPADGGPTDQKRIVENLLTGGIDGIAISPLDPDNQTALLNQAAEATKLITHDSDAPKSKRLLFIGVDNYKAGRACGKLVKEALPNGGKVMLFVGLVEQLNAKQRRQGLIDELGDRSDDANRFDPNDGKPIVVGKYTIVDTRTDQLDLAKAKSQAEDAIAKYADLDMMVGLFAYNAPKALAAIKDANKLGKIKIVSFDEMDETLQGIKDGHIYATVVQDPYQYGYRSVKVLAALARGDNSALKDGPFAEIPARVVKKENVDQFWADLKKLTAK